MSLRTLLPHRCEHQRLLGGVWTTLATDVPCLFLPLSQALKAQIESLFAAPPTHRVFSERDDIRKDDRLVFAGTTYTVAATEPSFTNRRPQLAVVVPV